MTTPPLPSGHTRPRAFGPRPSYVDRTGEPEEAFAPLLKLLEAAPACDEDTVERAARRVFGVTNPADSWDDPSIPGHLRDYCRRLALAVVQAPGGDTAGQPWKWHREPGTGDEWERIWNCCGGPYDEAPHGHYADCATDTAGQQVRRARWIDRPMRDPHLRDLIAGTTAQHAADLTGWAERIAEAYSKSGTLEVTAVVWALLDALDAAVAGSRPDESGQA